VVPLLILSKLIVFDVQVSHGLRLSSTLLFGLFLNRQVILVHDQTHFPGVWGIIFIGKLCDRNTKGDQQVAPTESLHSPQEKER
jgi:hypothetical protein